MLHRANEEACDAWEAAPLTLEQRYEQLARVAKEMLREINSCYEIADGVWHNGEYYRAQLEALGVVLDD